MRFAGGTDNSSGRQHKIPQEALLTASFAAGVLTSTDGTKAGFQGGETSTKQPPGGGGGEARGGSVSGGGEAGATQIPMPIRYILVYFGIFSAEFGSNIPGSIIHTG